MRGAAAAAAVALALAGCGSPESAAAAPAERRHAVDVAAAVAEPPSREVAAPGQLEAVETVRIPARIAGIVERVLVQDGDAIAPGQAVAVLDAQRYRLAAEAARARRARAEALRDDAAAQLRRREAAAAAQPGLLSDDDLAQVRARAAQAEAEAALAAAELAGAELDLADTRVTSPIAGTVEARLVASGDAVQPGSGVATVVDRSRILLRTHVPAGDAALLRPGLPAAFRTDGAPADGNATIILVGAAADPATRLVAVVAQVAAADAAGLRGGAFASVRIALPPGPPQVLVPDLAVRPSARGFLVYVVEGPPGAEVARERRVTLAGRTRDGRVAVAAGVHAGEVVVARGAEALRDGAPIDVRTGR